MKSYNINKKDKKLLFKIGDKIQKKCIICKSDYETYSYSNGQVCSIECLMLKLANIKTKEILCSNCGVLFISKDIKGVKHKCLKCSSEYSKTRRPSRKSYNRNCLNCNNIFFATRRNHFYCSSECSRQSYYKKKESKKLSKVVIST